MRSSLKACLDPSGRGVKVIVLMIIAAITAVFFPLHSSRLLEISKAEAMTLYGSAPPCVDTHVMPNAPAGCYKVQYQSCNGQPVPCDPARKCPATCVRPTNFPYPPSTTVLKVAAGSDCPDDVNVTKCENNGSGFCACTGLQQSFGCNMVSYSPLCGT